MNDQPRSENAALDWAVKLYDGLNLTRQADFLAPLLLRLYLVPIFWMAGTRKLEDFDSIVEWFGYGLGLPFPGLLAFLVTWTETLGAVCLLCGFAVRWMAVPMMLTMVGAMQTVHWPNGWLAIAEGSDSLFATERTIGAIERLNAAKAILQEHGNYDWLTENGNFVVLNNGIEFAATYLIMLLVLFFFGAGRYVSVDYWIRRKLFPPS